MAAGLGTRLRPLTWDIPKPIVPVANATAIEHLLALLAAHRVERAIANLHWFGDRVRRVVGDGSGLGISLEYSDEPQLLGTAGGVRAVRDFLCANGEEPFIVMAGDTLTDVDLSALVAAHRQNGGVATLAVKQVDDVSRYGVVVADAKRRITGFQEKPDPAEALSDLSNCMIYVFSPQIFEHFPTESGPLDFANDIFPALLAQDVPFHLHQIDAYWNDIGSLPEYLRGNLDAVEGRVALHHLAGRIVGPDDAAELGRGVSISGRVLLGDGAVIGERVRLDGPLVVGPGAKIGAAAKLKESVLLAGAEIATDAIVARAIIGNAAELRAD